MRILALAILAIGAVSVAAPAQAQTYDRAAIRFACMSTAGASYYDCSYNSLPQCNASASGRAAQCVDQSVFRKCVSGCRPTTARHAADLLSAVREC